MCSNRVWALRKAALTLASIRRLLTIRESVSEFSACPRLDMLREKQKEALSREASSRVPRQAPLEIQGRAHRVLLARRHCAAGRTVPCLWTYVKKTRIRWLAA
jgi:hypothetical protein